MSGDYSRNRFDPRKHFTNVLMQQGRVQLDSDWNEMAGVFDRRFRAQLADTLGRFVVPRRTPDAFRVARVGKKLTIGPGRMYVDGLMPENHGAGAPVFDPVLHEPRGADAIDYATGQPYFPPSVVPPLPFNVDSQLGPILVYLDTWQREVTFVEDPSIVEPALGIDTAARTQIAWRVRFLEHPDLARAPTLAELDPIAKDPPAYWADLTRPPAGRLTTATDDAFDPEVDPCIIPPSGGFRGLENQLYRVEIHDSGAPGKATFKWSRDNASVASQVTATDLVTNTLAVANIGRDAVLRFSKDDWVELLDDLQEPDAVRGAMLLVKRVDDDARLIEFDAKTPIPPAFAGTADALAARRTRLRRWDQRGTVKVGDATVDLGKPESGGLLPIPEKGGKVLLEHGVTVEFTVADKTPDPFRAGDFWTFAARTATADIDRLSAAPPQGHHHHYAPLAWVNSTELVDLRRKWPDVLESGGGDCDLQVTAEGHNSGDFTIQDAINKLRDSGGGSICLGRGVFFITADTLRIERFPGALDESGLPRRGLTLRGRGPQTVLIRQFTLPPLPPGGEGEGNDDDDDEPQPEDFETNRGDFAGRSLLRIADAADVTLADMVLVSSAAADLRVAGVVARTVADLRIERCFFLHAGTNFFPTLSPALSLGGAIARAEIVDNTFVAAVGIGHDGEQTLVLSDLDISRNTFSCRRRGVDLGEAFVVHLRRTTLAGNDLACGSRGIHVSGLVHDGGLVDIADNTVDVGLDGIVVGATRVLVRNNTVRGPHERLGSDSRPAEPDTFFFTSDTLTGIGVERRESLDLCRIEGNTIRGFDCGVLCNSRVNELQVRGNLVEEIRTQGISVVGDPAFFGTNATVEGNTVRNLGTTLRRDANVLGINLFACHRATVRDNALLRVGDLGFEYPGSAGIVAGIHIILSRVVTVTGNQLVDIGPTGPVSRPPADCNAITMSDIFESIDISGNSVGHTNSLSQSISSSALLIGQSPDFFTGAAYTNDAVLRTSGLRRTISIRGNRLSGIRTFAGARNPVVRIILDAYDLNFSDNHVQLFITPNAGQGDYFVAAPVNTIPTTLIPPTIAKVAFNTFESMPAKSAGFVDITAARGCIVGNIFAEGSFRTNLAGTHSVANDLLPTNNLFNIL